jgi:hypothetical protein
MVCDARPPLSILSAPYASAAIAADGMTTSATGMRWWPTMDCAEHSRHGRRSERGAPGRPARDRKFKCQMTTEPPVSATISRIDLAAVERMLGSCHDADVALAFDHADRHLTPCATDLHARARAAQRKVP